MAIEIACTVYAQSDMSNKDNILDSNLENRTLDLSNFQLVSLLSARVKLDKDIIEKVETELASRKIDAAEIRALEEKYWHV